MPVYKDRSAVAGRSGYIETSLMKVADMCGDLTSSASATACHNLGRSAERGTASVLPWTHMHLCQRNLVECILERLVTSHDSGGEQHNSTGPGTEPGHGARASILALQQALALLTPHDEVRKHSLNPGRAALRPGDRWWASLWCTATRH